MSGQRGADERLMDLEVKASFAEDLLEELNGIVARQQQQLEALTREVIRLREQLAGLEAGRQPSLRDELPPHY
jgi:SlyX protein